MKFNNTKVVSVCLPLLLSLSISSALAVPVPGGSLDPLTIPKYVTPLVIPPVLYDDMGGTTPIEGRVALRQISQQVLPPPLPPTTLWAYGNPADPTTFNNPAFTFDVTQNTTTTVTWINELVDASGAYLPHIIQDAAGNPIIDQTLHWAAPNRDCLDGIPRTDCQGASSSPYTGPIPMVTHLHGAHVGPISDGFPEAWWLPAANNIPAGYATEGTFYDDINGGAPGSGSAVYQYANDQPTSTLWYHDHSLGITRLNVYAAGAGFWLIRDANDGDSGLVSGVLPGPAPLVGQDPNGDPAVRAAVREIPVAIQPKSFNLDGSQYYPADRAFFEGLGLGDAYAENTGVNIPFLPDAASDIAPVWNPEAFFNTMVVNGNTWPLLEVAPERYRLRLLNAADSRFMNLSLYLVNGQGDKLREIPIYQIGAEQSLLPQVVRLETGYATPLPGDGSDVDWKYPTCIKKNGKPVKSCVVPVPGTYAEQALLLGPAERADVIFDFAGLEDGDQLILFNTAPDAPFGGFPDVPADPATTGQVMMFQVNINLANPAGDLSTPAPLIVLDANPGGVPKNGPSSVTQDLALLEEESALLCVTVDAVTGVINLDANSVPPLCDPVLGSFPFAPKAAVLGVNGSAGGTAQMWDDHITQNPTLNSIQTWELWNWSADAHPIHLHLVKFEVVNREVIGGAVRQPEPWEAGWKDTVIAYPGEVTRVKALFDIAGLYVWHCHILSHEDNEMMVPYCVGDPVADPDGATGLACSTAGGWPIVP
jgi:FtsP/CotA-like multicopper oxidase with cupredoxin domain